MHRWILVAGVEKASTRRVELEAVWNERNSGFLSHHWNFVGWACFDAPLLDLFSNQRFIGKQLVFES